MRHGGRDVGGLGIAAERHPFDPAGGAYTSTDHPRGCMVVLAGTNLTRANQGISDFLTEKRRANLESLRERLRQGVTDGDLPGGADVDAMTAFYGTILYGLSIQARDGAGRDELTSVIDSAMASWERFTDKKGVALG